MRVLCVLPYVPYPAYSGGTQRTLELVRALAERFELTVLASVALGEDVQGFRGHIGRHVRLQVVPRALRRPRHLVRLVGDLFRGAPLTYLRYGCGPLADAFCSLMARERFDIIHFDHLHTAQFLPTARALRPDARLVLDEHNVESRVLERASEVCPSWMRPMLRGQARRVRSLEAHLLSLADLVLACSRVDAEQLQGMGARAVSVVPNGTATLLPSHVGLPGRERNDVVFVGAMDWLPNSDAAVHLARAVWPRVERELAPSRLLLVGRNPPASVRAQAGRNVVVTGTVPSVQPYLERAWATAIPLRIGSGTRLKILEAAAAGVPIVATPLAAEGLPLQDGREALLVEGDEAFARALRYLRQHPDAARAMARRAAEFAARYAWSEVGVALDGAYRSLARA